MVSAKRFEGSADLIRRASSREVIVGRVYFAGIAKIRDYSQPIGLSKSLEDFLVLICIELNPRTCKGDIMFFFNFSKIFFFHPHLPFSVAVRISLRHILTRNW